MPSQDTCRCSKCRRPYRASERGPAVCVAYNLRSLLMAADPCLPPADRPTQPSNAEWD